MTDRHGVRLAAVALVIAGVAGGTAACGAATAARVASLPPTGGAPAVSRPSTTPSAADELSAFIARQQRWVDCLRAHGVPKAPDPQSDGHVIFHAGDAPSDPAVQETAVRACESVRPTPPASVNAMWNKEAQQTVTPAQLAAFAARAKCLHQNGDPGAPDNFFAPPRPVAQETAPNVIRASQICDAKEHPGVQGVG